MTTKLTKECLNCGRTFEKPNTESRKAWEERHKFCSKSCIAKHFRNGRNTQFTKERHYIPPTAIKSGQHLSPQTELKTGHKTWNKGMVGYMAGPKNPMWRGGVTPIHARLRKITEYKQWRKSVFERDRYICQLCGISGAKAVLAADHIVPFSVLMDRLREEQGSKGLFRKARKYAPLWDISNGRTLCRSCHVKTPTYSKGAYSYV